jgi:hypothetical protein
MKQIFTAIAAAVFATVPANASPERVIVNPSEPMVMLAGLEFLGYSRISTVEACAEWNGIKDYSNLITDEELYSMEGCLQEME